MQAAAAAVSYLWGTSCENGISDTILAHFQNHIQFIIIFPSAACLDSILVMCTYIYSTTHKTTTVGEEEEETQKEVMRYTLFRLIKTEMTTAMMMIGCLNDDDYAPLAKRNALQWNGSWSSVLSCNDSLVPVLRHSFTPHNLWVWIHRFGISIRGWQEEERRLNSHRSIHSYRIPIRLHATLYFRMPLNNDHIENQRILLIIGWVKPNSFYPLLCNRIEQWYLIGISLSWCSSALSVGDDDDVLAIR